MPKQLSQHTDEGFVRGYRRYLISEMVIESETWEDLGAKLDNFFEDEMHLKDCYDEYKIFNIALHLQQKLCEILGMTYKSNHLKNPKSLKNYVVQIAKQNLNTSTAEQAEKILEDETSDSSTSIYTPHALLYVAGLTLGQVIGAFRDFVNIPNKETTSIVEDLSKFNKQRNELMHNLFSSRIASLEQKGVIDAGIDLIHRLDEIHHEYLFPSPRT